MAFERDIIVRSRHVTWGGASGEADIIVLGQDLSAASFVMTIATATPTVLSSAAAGSQGVSASYDPDYVHPTTFSVVGATIIRPQIDEATLEAAAFNGDPFTAKYDILCTPNPLPQRLFCFGTFKLYPGISD